MSEDQRPLREHPFLRDLPEHHLAALAGHWRERRYEAGEFLVREGEPAEASYLIQEGRVMLEIHHPSRGAIQLQTVGEGGVLGWSWLIAPYRWHFDARAVTPTRALVLAGPALLAVCESDPALGFALTRRFLNLVQQRVERIRMQLLDLYAAEERGR